jgi:eukaryotic-like serine/threonine-protein kinase
LSINPNDPILLRKLALQYLFAGRSSLVSPLVERARQIDPLTAARASIQFDIYLSEGTYDLLLAFSRKWYESDPDGPMSQASYALALIYNSRYKEALSIIDGLAATSPDNAVTKFALLAKYGMLKDREKAFRILTPDFQKTCRRDYQWSYTVAEGLAAVGAKKEALDWLENAISRGYLDYESMERDFLLDNIRGEERFKKLMERAKYLSDHFEV